MFDHVSKVATITYNAPRGFYPELQPGNPGHVMRIRLISMGLIECYSQIHIMSPLTELS